MEYIKNNKQGFLAAALLLIAVLAFWGFSPKKVDKPEPVQSSRAEVVSYTGIDGRTALQLLKANYEVKTETFGGAGEFVTSIDGRAAGINEFWAFYVNGKMAETGASDYKTKTGELIEWKIEKVQ